MHRTSAIMNGLGYPSPDGGPRVLVPLPPNGREAGWSYDVGTYISGCYVRVTSPSFTQDLIVAAEASAVLADLRCLLYPRGVRVRG